MDAIRFIKLLYVVLYVDLKTYSMNYSIKLAPEKRKGKDGLHIKENVPLFADIRFSGTRFFYFTGYRVNVDWSDPKKSVWNLKTSKVRNNSSGHKGKTVVSAHDINEHLEKIQDELRKYFKDISTASKEDIIKILDAAVSKGSAPTENEQENSSDFFAMFEKFLNVEKFSFDRTKHFKSVITQWKRYETKRRVKLSFDNITVDVLRDFEKYLREESTKPKATRKPEIQVLSPKGKNTIHKILAMTRAFWNFARTELKREDIIINYPFGKDGYTIPGDSYGKPIYITKEERNLLFGAQLDSERLRRVRDIFVFQCLVGARVGDLCKFTKANIQNGVLTYIPRKTKDGKPVTVTVPLSANALKILARYDQPDGTLLPFITDQRYNEYLKELFRLKEINRIVTRLNPTTGEEEQVKLCDIVSSHMARRAFIGNLYGKVDSGIISSMSGHVKGSKAFARYYDVSPELQQQAINLID